MLVNFKGRVITIGPTKLLAKRPRQNMFSHGYRCQKQKTKLRIQHVFGPRARQMLIYRFIKSFLNTMSCVGLHGAGCWLLAAAAAAAAARRACHATAASALFTPREAGVAGLPSGSAAAPRRGAERCAPSPPLRCIEAAGLRHGNRCGTALRGERRLLDGVVPLWARMCEAEGGSPHTPPPPLGGWGGQTRLWAKGP